LTSRRRQRAGGGRARDAARSREAILEAAEALFSERGLSGASLHEIAAAAGLARATPSYFFGSKDALYAEVLRRVLAAREAALVPAFAPVREWARVDAGDRPALEDVIAGAIAGYFAFLDRRPSFARLIEWEALAGTRRLGETLGHSTAISDAVRTLHEVRRERGLQDFNPTEVQVALVSLCFLPVAHQATFRSGGGIDTGAPEFRAGYAVQVTRIVLFMLRG
jgi:TetR/AcrR family transcriptional regulator